MWCHRWAWSRLLCVLYSVSWQGPLPTQIHANMQKSLQWPRLKGVVEGVAVWEGGNGLKRLGLVQDHWGKEWVLWCTCGTTGLWAGMGSAGVADVQHHRGRRCHVTVSSARTSSCCIERLPTVVLGTAFSRELVLLLGWRPFYVILADVRRWALIHYWLGSINLPCMSHCWRA